MQVIKARTRNMQEEFSALGIKKSTHEVRESYDLITFRSNLSFMPKNETQTPHKHIMVREAIHVLAGQIEVCTDGDWNTLIEKEAVLFELNEIHNIRTGNFDRSILFPGTMNNTAAVVIVYKWIPPYFEIYEDEISFVFDNDWFDLRYKDPLRDHTASPILLLDSNLQEKFWNIADRNKVPRLQ